MVLVKKPKEENIKKLIIYLKKQKDEQQYIVGKRSSKRD